MDLLHADYIIIATGSHPSLDGKDLGPAFVNIDLAEAGIDGRLTVTEVSGLEDLGRFYQHQTNAENPWKPYLRIDFIVSDRQTESAINIILRQANLAGGRA